MLQAIIQFSLKNRWLVLVLTAAAALLGAAALQRLPIDAVPDITNNQVQINTLCPSLSPLEMERQVTFPIENSLAGIPGLQSSRSLSRNGFSQVTAIFADDVNVYFARQQIAERLSAARESLPIGAEPTMGPVATGLGEIYMYTVSFEHPQGQGASVKDGVAGWQTDGSYLTPEGRRLASGFEQQAYLREVQDWIIRPQLRSLKGVAGVDTIGGFVKHYQVQPDPRKLAAYGLSFGEVIETLEHNNVNAGAGYVERQGEAQLVRVTGRIERPEEIGDIVVATRQGLPIRIRDLTVPGGIGIGRELRTGSASRNGEEVVVGTAVMLIGANSRTVAAAVDAKMTDIARSLPPGIQAASVLNRTKLVDATISTVKKNLLEGAILVIFVLLLLLGNVRAALICALAIPLAMCITAIGMLQYKVSGNLMSLGAIDFGLIVDGAVIIVENCLRRLAEKQHHEQRLLTLPERLHEVMVASREMIQPSVYGQAIIITVYFPILALSGVEGKMFHPMAMTVIFALVAAFILSMTFVPAMVAVLVRGKVAEGDGWIICKLKQVYAPVLHWAMVVRWAVVPVAILGLIGSGLLFLRLGQEFIPTLDEKDLCLQAMRIPSTSLTQSQRMQSELERLLAGFPEVACVFSKTGTAELAADPMPPCVSDTFVIFKPESQWRSETELNRLAEAKEAELECLTAGAKSEAEEEPLAAAGHKGALLKLIDMSVRFLPGNKYEFTQPIQMRFNELLAGVRGDVAVKVYGDDFDAMQDSAQKIAAALQTVPGAEDVKIEQTEGLPVMTVALDRAALARYGLSVTAVQTLVSTAMGGQPAGQIFEGDRRFDLVVRLPEALRDNREALDELLVPLPAAADGKPAAVPLRLLARISVAEGLNQISRENGKRRIVVQANVRGRDLGSFVLDAQAKVNKVAVAPGQWLEWGGQYQNLVAAKERLSLVVPACFLLILLLLFSTFKSVKYALLVFSAVPLGLSGGVLALWLRGMPFSISAAVGFIALSGVAVLNGLVMVSFINQLRREGMERDEAIRHGCLTRLRPVLMTALVASLGFVPMALAQGAGAEVQKPLATVVIGGLISSTLLTLVVLPALYRIFTGWDSSGKPMPVEQTWEKPEEGPLEVK